MNNVTHHGLSTTVGSPAESLCSGDLNSIYNKSAIHHTATQFARYRRAYERRERIGKLVSDINVNSKLKIELFS